MSTEIPSDQDLLRDLEAFRVSQQPKPQAAGEQAASWHTVEVALQQIGMLEGQKATLIGSRIVNFEEIRAKYEALLRLYGKLQKPDEMKTLAPCPKHKFYSHALVQYQWVDDLGRVLKTSASEQCASGKCATDPLLGHKELFTERKRVWEQMRLLFEEVQSYGRMA